MSKEKTYKGSERFQELDTIIIDKQLGLLINGVAEYDDKGKIESIKVYDSVDDAKNDKGRKLEYNPDKVAVFNIKGDIFDTGDKEIKINKGKLKELYSDLIKETLGFRPEEAYEHFKKSSDVPDKDRSKINNNLRKFDISIERTEQSLKDSVNAFKKGLSDGTEIKVKGNKFLNTINEHFSDQYKDMLTYKEIKDNKVDYKTALENVGRYQKLDTIADLKMAIDFKKEGLDKGLDAIWSQKANGVATWKDKLFGSRDLGFDLLVPVMGRVFMSALKGLFEAFGSDKFDYYDKNYAKMRFGIWQDPKTSRANRELAKEYKNYFEKMGKDLGAYQKLDNLYENTKKDIGKLNENIDKLKNDLIGLKAKKPDKVKDVENKIKDLEKQKNDRLKEFSKDFERLDKSKFSDVLEKNLKDVLDKYDGKNEKSNKNDREKALENLKVPEWLTKKDSPEKPKENKQPEKPNEKKTEKPTEKSDKKDEKPQEKKDNSEKKDTPEKKVETPSEKPTDNKDLPKNAEKPENDKNDKNDTKNEQNNDNAEKANENKNEKADDKGEKDTGDIFDEEDRSGIDLDKKYKDIPEYEKVPQKDIDKPDNKEKDSDLSKLEDKLKDLENKFNDLEAKLAEKDLENEKLKAENDDLKNDNKDLSDKNDNLEKDKTDLADKNNDLTKENNDLKIDNDNLKSENDSLKNEIDNYKNENADLKEKLADMASDFEKYKEENEKTPDGKDEKFEKLDLDFEKGGNLDASGCETKKDFNELSKNFRFAGALEKQYPANFTEIGKDYINIIDKDSIVPENNMGDTFNKMFSIERNDDGKMGKISEFNSPLEFNFKDGFVDGRKFKGDEKENIKFEDYLFNRIERANANGEEVDINLKDGFEGYDISEALKDMFGDKAEDLDCYETPEQKEDDDSNDLDDLEDAESLNDAIEDMLFDDTDDVGDFGE